MHLGSFYVNYRTRVGNMFLYYLLKNYFSFRSVVLVLVVEMVAVVADQ